LTAFDLSWSGALFDDDLDVDVVTTRTPIRSVAIYARSLRRSVTGLASPRARLLTRCLREIFEATEQNEFGEQAIDFLRSLSLLRYPKLLDISLRRATLNHDPQLALYAALDMVSG
jgi:hypothetical protein